MSSVSDNCSSGRSGAFGNLHVPETLDAVGLEKNYSYYKSDVEFNSDLTEFFLGTIMGFRRCFIYLVSSVGITCVQSEFAADLTEIVKQIKQTTKIPVFINFDLSAPNQVVKMYAIADGIIVGSTFVKIVTAYGAKGVIYLKNS